MDNKFNRVMRKRLCGFSVESIFSVPFSKATYLVLWLVFPCMTYGLPEQTGTGSDGTALSFAICICYNHSFPMMHLVYVLLIFFHENV